MLSLTDKNEKNKSLQDLQDLHLIKLEEAQKIIQYFESYLA